MDLPEAPVESRFADLGMVTWSLEDELQGRQSSRRRTNIT
jgi:hypothetical protein